MDKKNGFYITNRDRVLRAWENSTELVRDYENYAHQIKDDPMLSQCFADYAKEEAEHASNFLEILQGFESEQIKRSFQ